MSYVVEHRCEIGDAKGALFMLGKEDKVIIANTTIWGNEILTHSDSCSVGVLLNPIDGWDFEQQLCNTLSNIKMLSGVLEALQYVEEDGQLEVGWAELKMCTFLDMLQNINTPGDHYTTSDIFMGRAENTESVVLAMFDRPCLPEGLEDYCTLLSIIEYHFSHPIFKAYMLHKNLVTRNELLRELASEELDFSNRYINFKSLKEVMCDKYHNLIPDKCVDWSECDG